MSVISILSRYGTQFLDGLRVTMLICLLVWSIGLVMGVLLGIAGHRWRYAIGTPTRFASFVLGGIPVLVFLFWLHYPLQALLQIVVDPFWTAVAALSVINTLQVADAIRRALDDFPQQFVWAARVCGVTSRDIVSAIQLPMVIRGVLPTLIFQQVAMLQASLFASLISVDEIFRIAQRVNSELYRPVEIYSALALFFLCICLPLNGIGLWLRSRFTRDLSDR
jgi:His/Glu/Gln/Arg/opine family amino acid ABC transporter permease subunit